MARIVSQPLYGSWSKTIDCEMCAVVYEVDHTDVVRDEGSQWDSYPARYCVVCPKCRNVVVLDPGDLPDWLKKTAKRDW